MSETSRVRIRGIYTTALTERLRSEFEVVEASPPIRRRFDAEFTAEKYDASVETTDDRQGAGVVGDTEAVEAIADDLADLDIDTFRWSDPAPRGAVFDGVVTDTLGGGAVVDLGDREGYLSFSKLDRRIHEDDRVRVQVHDPAAPWADRRPALGTEIQAFGGVASLSKGIDRVVASGDDATKTELARTTEMLPTEVPDDWGVRWGYAAADATVDAMDDALGAAVERAEAIDAGLADAPESADADADADASAGDPPRRLLAPEATTWCWFGRETRFALDEDRRDVTTTMPGHHRVKAAHESASAAVDFVEDLSSDAGGLADGNELPTGAALRQFGPSEGDRVEIRHGKPDGRCFSLGRGEVTECNPEEGKATVRRKMSGGGVYDALGTARKSGDVAVTKFREGRWWYPTVYRSADGESKGTYVNVCTPVELFPDSARYVDLHVDVVKLPDGEVERVDDDELDAAVESGDISEALAEKARKVASSVERALK
jgi:Ribonuclease G/E